MGDRFGEPSVDRLAASSRGVQERAGRSTVSGFVAGTLDQPGVNYLVDGAVDQSASYRPHSADFSAGLKGSHQGPAVGITLAQQCQHRPRARRHLKGGNHCATVPLWRVSGIDGHLWALRIERVPPFSLDNQLVTKRCSLPPMRTGLTRSQLFSSGVRGGAALVLAGTGVGALAGSADAAPPLGATGALAGDLAYTRLLTSVELLLADYWNEAIACKHLSGQALANAKLLLINETEHYAYLAGVLTEVGLVPLTAADVNFTYPTGAFYTTAAVTRLAVTLETLALGAYLGAAGNLVNPVLALAVAQITANEAQHLSAVSREDGQPAFHDAFPDAMTIAEASDALDAYTS
jgi:hypothetical protein